VTRPAKSHPQTAWVLVLVAFCHLLFAAGGLAADPPSSSWQVGYKGTGYAFQSQDRGGTTTDRFQQFHALSGSVTGIAGGWLTFRGSGRFANDQLTDRVGYEQAKWYTGLAEARIGRAWKARVGRQLVQAGVTSLTLDGAEVAFQPDRSWNLAAWGGAKAPVYHTFDFGDFDQNAALGGRIAYRPNPSWRLGISTAYRESQGKVAARPVGAEVMTGAVTNTRIFGRVAYDLAQDLWARVQAQAQWRSSASSPVVDLQYIDRYPTVDAASWFSRFMNLKRIRLARASVRYELPSRFGGEFEYLGSFVGTRTSSRLGLAALVPGGRVGYSLRLGDAGEENRFYGELGYGVTRWLWLGAEAAVMTYALMQDAPADQERDLTTLAARARLTLRPGLRVLAEVQSLNNPLFDEDVRFLVGLDVSMARGNSRFGLDRGGWLQ
jgi:hypothetical protein